MEFMIEDPCPPRDADPEQDPLEDLLQQCKGSIKSGDAKNNERPSLLAMSGRKLPMTGSVVGGVYWLPVEKTREGSWFEHMVLEPASSGFIGGGFAKSTPVYYKHATRSDLVGIPRFVGLSLFGPAERDLRTVGEPQGAIGTMAGLRPLQERALSQTLDVLKEWGGATIIADCGFGKTRLGLALSQSLGRKTMIICNREVLMLQWADSIAELMPQWSVGWLQGATSLTRDTVRVRSDTTVRIFQGARVKPDILLVSIETLAEGTVPKDLLKPYGTVLIDEMHHLAANTLVHVTPQLPVANLIGLSATPDRSDGLEHALYWLTGPASFVYKRLPSITGLRDTVEIRKRVTNGCTNKEMMYRNGQLAFASMITLLTEDPLRNAIIMSAIEDALVSGRAKVIVVSALVAHCVSLRAELVARAPNVITAVVAGPTTETVLAKAAGTRVVFATYGMLEEGYDDPLLDTLIMGTPRSRVQQTVGRIERTHEGKLRPLVVDLYDDFSLFPAMWMKRRRFYTSRGFAITER